MRKLKPVFLLLALLSGAAFAAEVGVSSRATTAAGDDVARAATTRTTANRVTASRNVPNATSATGVTTRATVSRATVSRGTDAAANSNTTRSTVSRSTTAGASRGTVSRATTNNTAKTTNATRAPAGDINSNPAVRRAGVTLRPSFADYGGRATIAGTGTMTGSNVRNDIQKISGRAAKNVTATAESIVGTRETLERTAELNKSCQEQYTECMDQFCAVIDANQKRCSCSSNLSRYTKVEKAVTEANNKLNEVAQAIRYIGLSADEIRAIMSETEAEEALRDNKDTSTTRNMLKQIESMIKDPTSTTNNYVSEMDFGLDMDLTFSSDPVDIFNLDFLNLGTNNSSISNLRGTELYRTAKKRCNTILTRCKEAGATQDQIIGNYDLAIDKDCIDYEAGLKKMNETLLSNVKSANLMLQKARLAVAQNKNQYDALGCVAALENCMKDDMVCGDDYLQCVDPTKAYIDESGEVVMGQDITVIQSFMTKYNNAVLDKSYLQSAYDTRIGVNSCAGDGKCVVKYLLQKIGTKQKVVDEGLCRAVLDKCQSYTYDKDGKYKPYNDIVINYLQRAMVSIKAAQQRIISDYASSCITDVAACYSQQVTQVSGLTSSANKTDVKAVMRGACRSIALTCGLAIFTGQPDIDPNKELITSAGKRYTVSDCKYITGSDVTSVPEYGTPTYNNAIINCVSDMFYDSLLSTLDSGSSSSSSGGSSSGGTTTTTYTVTFSCGENGSSQSWSQTNITANTSVMLPADPTTTGKCTKPDGKSFIGWSVNGGAAQMSGNITVTGNTNVVAQWGTGSYKITYKCGEGATGSDWTQENVVSPLTLPADPTTDANRHCTAPTSKKFGGWKVGTNDVAQQAGTQVQLTADTIITAVWGNGEYSYSYDCNNNGAGGSAPTAPNNGKVTFGNTIALSANEGSCNPPVAGKIFGNAWLDNNNAEKTGTVTWNYTQNQVFKAKWIDADEYTVQYNMNKPSNTRGTVEGTMADSTYRVGVAQNLTHHGYSLQGYRFNGWKDSNGNAYADDASFNLTQTPENNRVVLYAQWTPETYNVTYSCGSGSDVGGTAPTGGTVTYDTSYTLATNTCTKTGYTSDKMSWTGTWSSNGTSGSIVKSPGNTISPWEIAANVQFVATWAGVGEYICGAGQYLPANATACAPCPAGNWCVGGTYRSGSSDQGISGVCTNATFDCSGTEVKTNSNQCPDGGQIDHATSTKQAYTQTCHYTGTDGTGKTSKNDCTGSAPHNNKSWGDCYVTGCAKGYSKNEEINATSCVVNNVQCYATKYLPAGGTDSSDCTACPANSYCPGSGDDGFLANNSSDQGLYPCPQDYPYSNGGTAYRQADCYKGCSGNVVAHATSYTENGRAYYNNTCCAETCDTGYTPSSCACVPDDTTYALSYKCSDDDQTTVYTQNVDKNAATLTLVNNKKSDNTLYCDTGSYGIFMGWKMSGDNRLYLPGHTYTLSMGGNRTATALLSVKSDPTCTSGTGGDLSNGYCIGIGWRCLPGYRKLGGRCVPGCNGNGSGDSTNVCINPGQIKIGDESGKQCSTYYCNCASDATPKFIDVANKSDADEENDVLGIGYCVGGTVPVDAYTISYSCGLGTGTPPTSHTNIPEGETIYLKANDSCVRDGYSFNGWNTQSDGNGVHYGAGGGVSYSVQGNATLYAEWALNPEYTITYSCNGGTGTPPTGFSGREGETKTLSGTAGTCSKTDYEFLGWGTSSNTTDIITSYTIGNSDATLYAVWRFVGGSGGGNAYICEFRIDAGSYGDSYDHVYVCEDPENSSRKKIYSDQNCTDEITQLSELPEGMAYISPMGTGVTCADGSGTIIPYSMADKTACWECNYNWVAYQDEGD